MNSEEMRMRKPLAPILKKMKPGEKMMWPVEQSTSLQVSIGRVQREMRRDGIRFSMKTIGLEVEVTRTA